jgi:putative ABC transport system permease protein
VTVTRVWVGVVLRRAWGSLLFISLVAGLGGSIVATALLGAERTRTAVDRAFADADPPTARLESDSQSSIEALAALPGVRAVDPIELYPGRVDGSSADVILLVTPDDLGRTIDLVDLEHGRLPEPGAADEALLTRVLAERLGLGVGDAFDFGAISPLQLESIFSAEGPGDEALPPGPQLTLTIVGIGEFMIDHLLTSESEATAYVSTAFSRRHASAAGHLGGPSGVGGAGYLWLDGDDDVKGLAEVTDRAGAVSLDVTFDALADLADPLKRSNRMLAEGALVFVVAAGLALVAGIAAALVRHLARGRRDHEILASIGASRRTVVGLGTAETLPAAALAGILASIGTLLLARLTPFGATARRVDPDAGAGPGLPVLIAVGAAVAALTAVLAVVVAVAASRHRRVEEPRMSSSRLGWVSGPVAAAAGIRFALAGGTGTRRVPVRSALVAGILGVAGIVGGLAYAANLRHLEGDTARWGWTWSVLLDVYNDPAADANALAIGRDEIAGWAIITDVGSQVDGIESRAMSFEVLGGSVPLTLSEGRLPASPDEAVLGTGLARQVHGTVGEIVRVVSPSGDLPVTVVGIATLYPNAGDQLASPSLLLTPAGLDRVGLGERFVTLAFRAADGTTAAALYSRLAEVIGPDTITPTSQALADPPMEIAHITQLRPVPLALAAFFGALALALVGNALFFTPRRRAGDLAVLRALGLRPHQAAGALWWQAATISGVSLLVGLPLGLIAARVAFARLAHDAFVAPGPLTTPSLVVAVIGATIAVTLLLAVWPGRQAAILPIAQTLRAE